MIKFRQKEFSEADAMRPFYVKLQEYMRDRSCPLVQVIGKNEMLPILSGNNVIIEKFVLAGKFFGKDRFKMYLRFGSKVKLPNVFKLSNFKYETRSLLGDAKLNIGIQNNNNQNNNNQQNQKKKKKKFSIFNSNINGLSFALNRDVKVSLGDVVFYDKLDRLAVLEFDNIDSAIRSLNILPLGLNYKLYLLDL